MSFSGGWGGKNSFVSISSRFNIWYAGAIAAAGAAAVIIYLAGGNKDNTEPPASPVLGHCGCMMIPFRLP